MGWLEGVLTGYLDRHREIEQENLKRADQASALEGKLYESLLNSPDHQVRGMAATGILGLTQPRKRANGLRGWMGEMQGSPTFPALMKYITTPQGTGQFETVSPAVPSSTEYIDQPPQARSGALAQPESNPTELGSQPMTATAPSVSFPTTGGTAPTSAPTPTFGAGAPTSSEGRLTPPTFGDNAYLGAPPPGANFTDETTVTGHAPVVPERIAREIPGRPAVTREIMGLPHAFPTVEDKARAAKRGETAGDIEAKVEEYTQMFRLTDPTLSDAAAHTKAAALVVQSIQRSTATNLTDSIRAQYLDPISGQMREGYLTRNKQTGQMTDSYGNVIHDARPIISQAMGAAYEQAAAELFGTRAALVPPSGQAQLRERAFEIRNRATTIQAINAARAELPWASEEEVLDRADQIMKFTTPRPVAPGAGTPPPAFAPPTGGAAPVPQAGGAPAAAPAAAAGAVPQVAPEVGTRPEPPPSIAGGRLSDMADPANSGIPAKLVGKPLDASAQKEIDRARATNLLIDSALAALKNYIDAPENADKDMNSPAAALDIASNYRQGIYDPIESVAAQLGDLAGLQSSSSTALTSGSSRAFQIVQQRRQHVPRLPSSREVQAYRLLPAGAIATASGLSSAEGGFDSPVLMLEKLQQAKANNENFVREMMNVDIPTPRGGGPARTIRPRGTPGPSAPPAVADPAVAAGRARAATPTTTPGAAAAPGGDKYEVDPATGQIYKNGEPF